MLNHESEEELKSIALTNEEVRELLSLLAFETYAEPDGRSTIRDLVELTEVPTNTVARLLADIRDDNELSRLANRVEEHGERIKKLESIEPVINLPAISREEFNRLYAQKERERQMLEIEQRARETQKRLAAERKEQDQKDTRQGVAFFVFVFILIFLASVFFLGPRKVNTVDPNFFDARGMHSR